MHKIIDFTVRKYPSNIELVYYYAEYDLHLYQYFDLGILRISKPTIKEIQRDILEYVNSEPDVFISKKKAYEIAKKIKWYI